MIGSQRLRSRRRASTEVLVDWATRLAPNAEPLRCTVRGRYFRSASDEVLTLARSNLSMYWARGSGIFGVAAISGVQSNMLVGSPDTNFRDTSSASVSSAIAPGATSVTVASDTVSAGQWYYLRDINKTETHVDVADTQRIGGELVRVKTVSGSTVTLYHPITQSYASAAQGGDVRFSLLPSGANVTENVLVHGLRVSGQSAEGFECWVRAGLCAGLTFQHCRGDRSYLSGICVQFSRDVTLDYCSGRDLYTGSGTGSSYTFQFDRCVNVSVSQSWVRGARYGVTLDHGCATVLVDGFCADGVTVGAVDIHGGDSYDVTFNDINAENCDATLGNPSWRRGCNTVSVQNSKFRDLRVVSAVRNTSFDNVFANRINFETTDKDSNTHAPTGVPYYVVFSGCEIDCTATPNNAAINLTPISSGQPCSAYVIFIDTTVTQHVSNARALISQNPTAWKSFECYGCLFNAPGGAACVQLGKNGISNELVFLASNSSFIVNNGQLVAAGVTSGTPYATFYNSAPNYRGTAIPATDPLDSSDVAGVVWAED